MGLPRLGGFIGALASTPLVNRLGAAATLLIFGALRGMWMGLLPLAGRGLGGFAIIAGAETPALFCSGIFNPAFATFRMEATPDACMSRVATAWSISNKSVQPLFIAGGGVLAATTSTRLAIAVAAGLLILSAGLLPWRI
jgi:hypothetical protein